MSEEGEEMGEMAEEGRFSGRRWFQRGLDGATVDEMTDFLRGTAEQTEELEGCSRWDITVMAKESEDDT